jgi:glyoxylase-like metal-dependent hydrolase (beta-lactamase superfamily II)
MDPAVRTHHLPGHCPDGQALQLDGEALIVGDNLLPDITPHPTQEATFRWTERILPPEFDRAEEIYGLRAYLKTLKHLRTLGREYPGMIVLPAHRLFYDGRWRIMDLERRSAEIIEHHVQRCAAIQRMVKESSRSLEEIVLGQFEPRLLKGFGIKMAEGEVKSHLELLEHCGDVEWHRGGAVRATGSTVFEGFIHEMTTPIHAPA